MENNKKQVGSRAYDITTPATDQLIITINGQQTIAHQGETVLSALIAHGEVQISKNDYNKKVGAYCGMGVCFCCTVSVDKHKRRACKTVVYDGMEIKTNTNTQDIVKQYQLEMNV